MALMALWLAVSPTLAQIQFSVLMQGRNHRSLACRRRRHCQRAPQCKGSRMVEELHYILAWPIRMEANCYDFMDYFMRHAHDSSVVIRVRGLRSGFVHTLWGVLE